MDTGAALGRIFSNPRAVFTSLKVERKWIPAVFFMVLLLGIHAFVVAVGTQSLHQAAEISNSQIQIDFLKRDTREQLIADRMDSNQRDLRATVNSQSIDTDSDQGRSFFSWVMVLVGLLPFAFGFLCLLFLLEAGYFRIVGALLHLEIRLRDWFILAVWSRVPGVALAVLSVIVGAIALGRQPDSHELDILSLTRWVDLPEARFEGENWRVYSSFENFEASLIWVIALQAIGFQEWTGKSGLFSLGVVVLPTFVTTALISGVIWLA